MRIRVMAALAGAAMWLALAGGAFAENGFTLAVVDKPAPDDVEAEIKEAVVPKAFQISDGSGVFYELWFVPGLTAPEFGGTAKETLDKVEEITLLGIAVVANNEHHDFRDDPIDPGTYIMRLALQPKDGNHMGTAPYDTFAILIPAESDSELKKFRDHEMMVELASENTVAAHPPIFSLQPFDEAGGDVPRLEYDEEDDWTFLRLQLPVEAGGESKPIDLGLIIQGIGEL